MQKIIHTTPYKNRVAIPCPIIKATVNPKDKKSKNKSQNLNKNKNISLIQKQ
jgi:hypothetical protein